MAKDKLAKAEKSLGRDHLDIIDPLEQVSCLHRLLGQYDNAIALYSKQLVILEKEWKAKPTNYDAQMNLSNVLYSLGTIYNVRDETRSLASPLLDRCLDLRKKAVPANERSIADCYSALAMLNANLKQYTLAQKYDLMACDLYHKICPLVDPEVSTDAGRAGPVALPGSTGGGGAGKKGGDDEYDSDSDESDGGDDGLSWDEFKVFKQAYSLTGGGK